MGSPSGSPTPGPGIAAEHLDRLFDRFYRVDGHASREQGGSGLGLAIARSIAEAHGGTLVVESVVGRGSTFTLRIPGHDETD
jgi:signal transduction histidine kinase